VGAARPNEQKLYDDCVKYCKEHSLEEYITFAGLCNNVPEILGQMDAFIYATRHDSFGIAVIEAIASGLPTFTNDWCVMQEVTRNGQYAWLYKTGDINSLTELFIDFTKDPEKYYQKARLSATAVKKEYSIEQHATNLYNEYSRIL
jgi:glycosyltransferase involved in cell wall biosynthesis